MYKLLKKNVNFYMLFCVLRSETCPHCRSQVSINNLVKLFLQVDPHARVSWDRKTDEEIETLK